MPLKLSEIAFAFLVKNYALGFEQFLLEIYRYCETPGRAFALRIDDTLPRHINVSVVHGVANRPGSVPFAKNDRELAVCHHLAEGNLTDDGVNALAVKFVVNVHKKRNFATD